MSVAEGSGTPKSRGAGSGNPKASRGAKAAGSYGRGRSASSGVGQDRRRGAVRAAPARKAGTRLRTVPGRQPGTRRDAAPVRRPLMACAGVPRGTRAAVVRRRARVTGPAERHARPPETDRGGTAGPPRAASIGALGPQPAANTEAVSPRPAVSPGAAGLPGAASIAAAPGPRTTADFVLSRSTPGEGSRGRTSPGGRPGRPAEGGFRRDAEAGSDFRGARRPAGAGSRRTAPGDARRSPRPAGSPARPAIGSEGSRGDSYRAARASGRRAVPSRWRP